MNASALSWLRVRRGSAPLIVSIPHAGTLLADIEPQLESARLARVDTDWWVDRLYDFASDVGATIVATSISRTVIDVNRDPSARSLYPGMATTELVPTTTFDGVPLYRSGGQPDGAEQARRRAIYFDPYHAALRGEIDRLRGLHEAVVLYDAHSIRSRIPRLFEGELPMFNIGTFEGRSCSARLTEAVVERCERYSSSYVVNGRFTGGWITRTYGEPLRGVHALQMELACRAYMDEPHDLREDEWPPAYSAERAAEVRSVLKGVLERCIEFANEEGRRQ